MAGYLNGQANLVNSVGQYQTQYQQGRLLNQEVEREKMKTRQMLNDQLAYEEASKPKAEDVREQQRQLALRRARNDLNPDTSIAETGYGVVIGAPSLLMTVIGVALLAPNDAGSGPSGPNTNPRFVQLPRGLALRFTF